jgi:hypothetical protein
MAHERTKGMTIVGYLNMGIGALFALIGSLMAFAGSGFMSYSSAKAAGTPGDFIMLIGVATAAINLMLLAAGLGVMKMALWGRSLSLAYGAMGVVVYSAAIIGAGFDPFFTAALVYCIALVSLFFRPAWKSAFEPSLATGSAGTAALSQAREAA